jgi:membrane protease YdiL (CAAX protease family)
MEAQTKDGNRQGTQVLIVFYLLAFGISWLGWIPQALYGRGLFPFDSPVFSLMGGAGPTLAAVITLSLFRQSQQIRPLFAALLRVRASAGWFGLVFGFWFVVAVLALAVMRLTGQPLPDLSRFTWLSLPVVFVSMLITNVWEEIGWRGFALPRLQEKLTDLQTALLMGGLWSLWHAPLLLNPASPMASLPWAGEVIFSLSLTVIYIWLYRNTAGSLFFVTVFHAISNSVAFMLLDAGVFISSYPYVVGITAIAAALIIAVNGTKQFSRPAAARGGA